METKVFFIIEENNNGISLSYLINKITKKGIARIPCIGEEILFTEYFLIEPAFQEKTKERDYLLKELMCATIPRLEKESMKDYKIRVSKIIGLEKKYCTYFNLYCRMVSFLGHIRFRVTGIKSELYSDYMDVNVELEKI